MSNLSWIIVCLAIFQVSAQNDEYKSSNSPDFYEGEMGEFTCNFVLDKDKVGAIIGFGLRHKKGDEPATEIVECTVSRKPGGKVDIFSKNDPTVTLQQCEETFNALDSTGSGSLKFSMSLAEAGQYNCSSWSMAGYQDNSAVIDVGSLLVAPTKLDIKFSPENVYEGDEVTVTCVSEGGTPASVFEYFEDGESRGEPEPRFTATREHNNKKYTCRDKTHLNYNGGEGPMTKQEKILKVYYFSITKPATHNLPLNPAISKALSCDTESELPDGLQVSYSWTKNGDVLPDETDVMITIDQDPNLNETVVELYVCTASTTDGKLKPVTRTFNISWDGETSTPAITTTKAVPPSKKPGSNKKPSTQKVTDEDDGATMIIIGVVVAVTVIILIVVIVIIVVKKRKAGSANVAKSSEAAGPLPNKGDPEAGNGEAEAEAMLKNRETADESEK